MNQYHYHVQRKSPPDEAGIFSVGKESHLNIPLLLFRVYFIFRQCGPERVVCFGPDIEFYNLCDHYLSVLDYGS